MGAELPPGLRAALDRQLDGVARRGLAERAAATSAAYRAGGTSAAAIGGPEDALAYALARLPATYAAVAAVLSEARRLAPGFAPRRLLDAGAGPGGGSWAAIEVWPGLAEVLWLDASAPFLALAAQLAAEGPPALRAARAERTNLNRSEPFPPADLAIASYVLAELTTPDQARLVAGLWRACEGLLALVEPGTPAGHGRILAAREALIAAGAAVLAPCPHQGACPLAAPDWCHFSVRLPRSRDHQRAKGAALPFEDEKYAYLIAARPGLATGRPGARVLAAPRADKRGIDFKLCGPEGLERRFTPRRDKAAHAGARRLGWGELWPE